MVKESFNYRLYKIPLCITSYYKKINVSLFVIHITQVVLVTKHRDYFNTKKKNFPSKLERKYRTLMHATEASARHKLAMNLLNSIIL